MDARDWAARTVVAKLLAGPWTPSALAAGLDAVLGPGSKRVRAALIADLIDLNRDAYLPAPDRLTACLCESRHFTVPRRNQIAACLDPPRFAPATPFVALAIPRLATLGALAEWLGLSIEQLDWLADEKRCHRRTTTTLLQHYHYAFVAKHSGPPRLIEAPKPRLKAVQRKILREILDAVPVHDCAHGFIAGRSCLGGAHIHAGEAVVAAFDLVQFFPSVGVARIHGIFRSLGYPWSVARVLTGLCSTTTPAAVFLSLPEPQRHDGLTRALYAVPHLAQGAPTSPALANLAAWRLDRRLHGLARAAAANYTRYADDLAFSGDAVFTQDINCFRRNVETIVVDEGFALNAAKTRIMRRCSRQRVTGIVVNEHCNIGRAEFDALKAILHNCARHGPAGQNRAAVPDFRRHLDGRVAWVEQINLRRGEKLRRLFDAIMWPEPGSSGSDLRQKP
jgi:RNA-directed DNA polymerase